MSIKTTFGLWLASIRSYCGRHKWTFSRRWKKDALWSKSLHLEGTKIRRPKMMLNVRPSNVSLCSGKLPQALIIGWKLLHYRRGEFLSSFISNLMHTFTHVISLSQLFHGHTRRYLAEIVFKSLKGLSTPEFKETNNTWNTFTCHTQST